MVDAALGAAQWVVAKALTPVADTVLETWATSRNFGPNIHNLRMELRVVQATLEQARRKELGGTALKELLQELRDSAHNAEDLLDELDYFRIHDGLFGTYDAADEHGEGGLQDLALSARHTAKALGKLVNCFPWERPPHGDSPSASDTNQEVSGCMLNLGKLLLCSCSPHLDVGDDDHANAQETKNLEFNRVDLSKRMKDTIEQLKLVRKEVDNILKYCVPITVPDIAHSRPITTTQSEESILYGRDVIMNSIIHDITKDRDNGLTVLPVVGPGGMGKTTLIQHIYRNQQVQNHFPVLIWICVSLNFNLDKVLQEIQNQTPRDEGEKDYNRIEVRIEQRIKSSKRFLLVLDDIWQISNVDDWRKLLSTLDQSPEKGSMIVVTTRFQKIADQVKEGEEPIELNGLESEEFRKLFLAFIFDDGQCPRDKRHLLDTGYKIMEKLKGSPLAAKTVGRLLKKNLNRDHWKKVLNSKKWEETDNNGIMPALKLSYDFLPFHLQQCFVYSALFPEDYHFRSHELISLWIGLDILIPTSQNQTFEDIGMCNLNELVIHGFFREEKTEYGLRYVMHDLLHDLALKVASHDCLSLRFPSDGSVEIQSTTRHLSISTYDLGKYDAEYGKKLKSELKELKTRFKVEHLQTLMLFGKMDEGFVKIFGDFFGEVSALRVLHFSNMLCPVESMLHNFLGLVHLRYLCVGTNESEMHLPLGISKFYHLRILDLEKWYGSHDLPKNMSNLAKLCHFYVPSSGRLHSDIRNVGKLNLLEELKVFQVNKESEGFEPKQLEHLTKLRELGIYNLENIYIVEEAAQAKLMEKKYLRRLTLDWDRKKQSSVEPGVAAAVLESLQPQGDLQVLCIRGHGGPSCPTWLGDEFAVEGLRSLCLDGVSWEVFPSLVKACELHEVRLKDIARLKEIIIEESFRMLIKLELIGLESFEKWVFPVEQGSSLSGDLLPLDVDMFPRLQVLIIKGCPKLLVFPLSNWFPKLQELKIHDCPEFSSVIPISWIESLRHVNIKRVKLLEKFVYSKSSDGVEMKIIRQSRVENQSFFSRLLKRFPDGTPTFVSKGDLHSLDQVLDFDKETCIEKLTLESCPRMELKHFLMLTSLKELTVYSSDAIVGPLGYQGDVKWHLPIERIWIKGSNGNSGKELTQIFPYLPRLSKLRINDCKNIKRLVVGVDLQQATSEMEENEITTTEVEEGDGMLLFPPHLCDSLRELIIWRCPELVLVDPPTLLPGGGWIQDLRFLQRLSIGDCPKFLSIFSGSQHIFPSSLRFLELWCVEGLGTLEPLSNLSSLTKLELVSCGEDLKCQGLLPLLTTGGQLNELSVTGSPKFFAGWDPNPRWALEDVEIEEHPSQLISSILRELEMDDIAGLLAAPICSFLCFSLNKLKLCGYSCKGMERFLKEQEDALQLLSSLQHLEFSSFKDLQQLPAGLQNLTSLKKLRIYKCPAISSLPINGLPELLQELDVYACGNEELKQQCRGLVGTIPKISI